MSLHAALLLHIRLRNSTTRSFFSVMESIMKVKFSTSNIYFKNIMCKYYAVEFGNNLIFINILISRISEVNIGRELNIDHSNG